MGSYARSLYRWVYLGAAPLFLAPSWALLDNVRSKILKPERKFRSRWRGDAGSDIRPATKRPSLRRDMAGRILENPSSSTASPRDPRPMSETREMDRTPTS